jgi:hypothetical protein
VKLKEMVLHCESSTIDKLLFEVFKNATGEVHDEAAV